MQPAPKGLFVEPIEVGGRPWTAIVRHFPDGDHRRCTLCPRGTCGATTLGVCLVRVPGTVNPAVAGLYRIERPSGGGVERP